MLLDVAGLDASGNSLYSFAMPSPNADPIYEEEAIWLGQLAVWRHKVDRPRARVLLVHGISEHSGRHKNTFEFLARLRIEVVRFDMRGAGKSGGKRQWCGDFSEYVDDLDSVFQWICRQPESLPLYLMGHSLGGAIAIHFAAEHGYELDGLILSAPAYRTGKGVSPLLVFVGTWTDRIFPTFRIPKPIDLGGISRIPEVVTAYAKDPLVCHRNTVHQGLAVLKGLSQVPALCSEIQCPTVILHGSDDTIINLEGSFEILRLLESQDKSLHVLPGGYHEPHNDLNAKDFYHHLELWIENHLNPKLQEPESDSKPAKKSRRKKAQDTEGRLPQDRSLRR